MPQEQLLNARPPQEVFTVLLVIDLSLGANEVVGMAGPGYHKPTAIISNDQTVVVHFAKVPEQLRDAQTLVGKFDYGLVIEDAVNDESKSFRDLVAPFVFSKPFHQLEAFVVFKMEADLHPGEPSVLGQPDALLETARCLNRTKNLGEAAADCLAPIPAHEIQGLVIDLDCHDFGLILVHHRVLKACLQVVVTPLDCEAAIGSLWIEVFGWILTDVVHDVLEELFHPLIGLRLILRDEGSLQIGAEVELRNFDVVSFDGARPMHLSMLLHSLLEL